MIGYLFPDKSKLTLKERKIFRDYYCSLCLSIKYNYGNAVRLFASYDVAVLMMLSDYGMCIEDCGRCGRRIKNRKEKFLQPDFSVFADISMVLLRKKIEDDIRDEKGVKSFLLSIWCWRAIRKVQNANTKLNALADYYFNKYYQFEEVQDRNHPDSAAVALTYGRFMGEMFQRVLGLSDNRTRLLAAIIAWTFLADAIDDYDRDLRLHNFNALGNSYNSLSDLLDERKVEIEDILESLFSEMENAFLYIETSSRVNIILNNLIHHGMRTTSNLLIQGKKLPKQKLL